MAFLPSKDLSLWTNTHEHLFGILPSENYSADRDYVVQTVGMFGATNHPHDVIRKVYDVIMETVTGSCYFLKSSTPGKEVSRSTRVFYWSSTIIDSVLNNGQLCRHYTTLTISSVSKIIIARILQGKMTDTQTLLHQLDRELNFRVTRAELSLLVQESLRCVKDMGIKDIK